MKRLLTYVGLFTISALPTIAQPTNPLTNVFYIPAGGDCSVESCTSGARRMCRNSGTATTIYTCNTATGFYTAASGTGESSTKVVHICPSGCEYTTLNAACAAETSTAANPIKYLIHAGLYAAADTMCNGEDHASFIGDGRGVTTLQAINHGFGSGTNNDCTAEPNACKAALNLGTSTNYEVGNMTLKGNQGLRANNVGGVGGGQVWLHDLEFITTTSNGDEDCYITTKVQNTTTVTYENNRCSTNADGFTFGMNGTGPTTIYSHGNTFELNSTSGIGRQTGFILSSIPNYFFSTGDQFYMTTSRIGGNVMAYSFLGDLTGATAGRAVISSPIVYTANTAGTGNAGAVYSIYVDTTATELTNLDILGPYLWSDVPNDSTNGVANTIFLNTQTTTQINVSGGQLIATGGVSGSRSAFSVQGGTETVSADTFITPTPMDAEVTVRAMAGITSSAINTMSSLLTLNSNGQGTILNLINTNGGLGTGSPYFNLRDAQGTPQNWKMGTGIDGSTGRFQFVDDTGTALTTLELQPNGGSAIFYTPVRSSTVDGGQFLLGDGSHDYGNVYFDSTNDGYIQWEGATKTFIIAGTEAMSFPAAAAAPLLDGIGDFAIDTTADQWCWYSGGAVRCLTPVRTMMIPLLAPVSGDDPVIGKATSYPMNITKIECIVDPADSAESVVITLRECDGTADNCAGVDGATTITCTNGGAADDGSLSNPSIDLDDWIDLVVGTVTGTVSKLAITISYTEVRQ